MILLPMLLAVLPFQDNLVLKPGLVISKSAKVQKGQVMVDAQGVTIKGDDITVDFNGTSVRSRTDVIHDRDTFEGVGILVDGCKNVVIKNAITKGYRFNIKIVNSTNVRIEGCDVGYSRAIRMMKDGAPIDTFLVLRDSNAWKDYGAGVWLEKSTGCSVTKTKGMAGTIGLAMVDTTGTTVTQCDFSFCGGWGVAMSRSSGNTVSWNLMDFNNRVWGGGWGADAAAMGIADDCDHNFIVGNSMTHSGDGFFLSNTNDIGPVDPATGFFTPQGGSDHNVIAFNDGSWSPANAFEGTFSDGNVYYRNIATASNYGFWLGFSTNTLLIENMIVANQTSGIAIEHGKGTKIEGNEMIKNGESAIHLWASPQKERKPFPSTAIDILNNTIQESKWAYQLEGSSDYSIKGNTVTKAEIPAYANLERVPTSALEKFKNSPEWTRYQEILKTRPKDFKLWTEKPLPKGIEWIQPDEFGPRDFRNGIVAWRRSGPNGIEVYLLTDTVMMNKPSQRELLASDKRIVALGLTIPDGPGEDEATVFSFESPSGRKQEFMVPLRRVLWETKWFSWKGLTYDDSRSWEQLFKSNPLDAYSARTIDGEWSGRSPGEGIPTDHFALLATTQFKFVDGTYTFNSVSDDGFRLLIDGKPVIERWNHHGPTPDSATLQMTAGVHEMRVEYCQEDGAAVLRLDWSHKS